MRYSVGLAVFAATIFANSSAFAADAVAVDKNAPLRSELLDAARPSFQTETGGPVQFVVNALNVWGDWAYARAELERPDGKCIDWTKTKYAQAVKDNEFDGGYAFFMLRRSNGHWAMHDFAFGPTDFPPDGWRTSYKLPTAGGRQRAACGRSMSARDKVRCNRRRSRRRPT